jgi:hypothetical protein
VALRILKPENDVEGSISEILGAVFGIVVDSISCWPCGSRRLGRGAFGNRSGHIRYRGANGARSNEGDNDNSKPPSSSPTLHEFGECCGYSKC